MPLSTKAKAGLLLGIGALAAAAWSANTVMHQAKATAQAYLYGYPLVLMEVTKQQQNATGTSAVNHLQHNTRFPDADYRAVVTPNLDTFYSMSHLDLKAEPVIMYIPPNSGHFYMMQIMDAWTNVVDSPGTRTIGDASKTYLIAGPNWQGEPPAGVELLKVPTNLIWVFGRFRATDPDDLAPLTALRNQFKLMPLSEWQTGKAAPTPAMFALPRLEKTAPDLQLRDWSRDEFFATFCQLLQDNPGPEADAPMLERIRATGLVTDSCQPQQSWLQGIGSDMGYRKVMDVIDHINDLVADLPTYNGWRIAYDLGRYGTDYQRRAAIAKLGLGANLPEDAIYPSVRADTNKQLLSGSHRYRLHFAADALPPVRAFWSLTLYNDQQFLVANALNRYALGSRDDLHYNADGSLDLYIQHEAPANAEQQSNWLPAPKDGFNLFLRLYWPEQAALDQSWLPPTIELLD
ncbi:DUF1254 domain-containing protein [Halopseudomonas maritima]|uniref:DUF1254 domain-containing protein n=1 Tax=Halopseudomonas maritima TaxID=2918528 RepID=UPI001EEA249E|nr:DUF1254 domain-containing protein [Halopseudomonas maritima]UJJ31636.1 DUF1254 domain-containing protein [Halopseudomonas maritima]